MVLKRFFRCSLPSLAADLAASTFSTNVGSIVKFVLKHAKSGDKLMLTIVEVFLQCKSNPSRSRVWDAWLTDTGKRLHVARVLSWDLFNMDVPAYYLDADRATLLASKRFYENEWDDDFALRSPKPRRERRPKHNPVLEEDIIEEEEENVNDNDESRENVDPQVDSDLPAVQELNEKNAIAEEWSLYIESEDGERMKAVGNKLVAYETYTGHKATAHLFPKREKTPPPSEEEVKALDRARCDSYWAHVDRFLGPVKKKSFILDALGLHRDQLLRTPDEHKRNPNK
ncbi:unnamed protein product [Cylicocyclus nassatus]|uniref:Uncharacterized protein n=1 Tax=Cylicocyclus nassatus TaxID=53992 RepID=A0AA36M5Q6_CYLNA|nr:unnamed protein product [Cylicocyclus nassatus]